MPPPVQLPSSRTVHGRHPAHPLGLPLTAHQPLELAAVMVVQLRRLLGGSGTGQQTLG